MFSVDASTIKYLETSRGVAFNAALLQDGVKVGTVENEGCGGGTFARTQSTDSLKELYADISNSGLDEEAYLENLMDVAEGIA